MNALLQSLIDSIPERERAKQVETGASQAGGCTAAALFRLAGTEPSDKRLSWQAEVGAAIHAHVLPSWAMALGGGEEERLSYKGLPVTADLVAEDIVIDLKTTTQEGLAERRKYGPKVEHVAQVQLGAAACNEAIAAVASTLHIDVVLPEITRVAVVYVPRDGDLEDSYVWEDEFRPEVAEQAWQRVQEQNALAAAGADPANHREQPAYWCHQWCEYVSLCRGTTAPGEDDPEVRSDVETFLARKREAKDADLLLKASHDVMDFYDERGVDLSPYGVKFVGGNPKTGVEDDVDGMKALIVSMGLAVPQRVVETHSSRSLRVVPVKKAAA